MMQSLMDPTKGLKLSALEGDAFAAAMGRLFGFAFVWALGGNLAPTCSEAFDEFAREHLQDVVTFPGRTAEQARIDQISKKHRA
jgi:dynein heavy chain